VPESSDRDLIRREVSALVKGMKQNGARFVYASRRPISANVECDNFTFAPDAFREHLTY